MGSLTLYCIGVVLDLEVDDRPVAEGQRVQVTLLLLLLLLWLLKQGQLRLLCGQDKDWLLLLRLDLWESVDGAADELCGALHAATHAAAAVLDSHAVWGSHVIEVVHALEVDERKSKLRHVSCMVHTEVGKGRSRRGIQS